MPFPFLFLKQSHVGPDANLCGFFALYHFRNGGITRGQFKDAATYLYTRLGIDNKEAAAMAADSNDPAVLAEFGLQEGNKGLVDKFEVLIVCDTIKGHFFTIRKEGGKWWNYDSWTYDQPHLIGDDAAAKLICDNHPIYYG